MQVNRDIKWAGSLSLLKTEKPSPFPGVTLYNNYSDLGIKNEEHIRNREDAWELDHTIWSKHPPVLEPV